MSVFLAALLGLVQGLCEFLPVSSSGHLVLLQNIFGITEGRCFLTRCFTSERFLPSPSPFEKPWAKCSAIPFANTRCSSCWPPCRGASHPAVPQFHRGQLFRLLAGLGLLVTAILLFVTDRISASLSGKRRIEKMRPGHALLIGAAQGLAVFPGFPAPAPPFPAGFLLFGRSFAAEFAFMMSIPAILGAAVLQGRTLLRPGSAAWIGCPSSSG